MKNWITFFVIVAVVALVGLFCYTQLEIVDSVRWESPSREARTNPYLALERWLSGQGIQVRTLSGGDIDTVLEGPEKAVVIFAESFDWSEEQEEEYRLTPWVKAGGSLIILINTYYTDWQLAEYLETLGIEEYDRYSEETDDSEIDAAEADGGGEADDESGADTPEPDIDDATEEIIVDYSAHPFLDDKEFFISETSEDVDKISFIPVSMYENSGKVRFFSDRASLVVLEMGDGSLTVTGDAYFLRNGSIREEGNANLAAALFPKTRTENGVLFIRGGVAEKHLFGSLAERGNTIAILISTITLVVLGFWMVVPLFGRTKPVKNLPGKPLGERFLAEGRFLLAYNGLDRYLSAYDAELERRRRITGVEKRPVMPGRQGRGNHPDKVKKISLRNFIKSQMRYIAELEELNGKIF
ncbi:MAG: DUF4350 domain-containing protein [Treponema sp.]|jgi:hypothetical protein|nr:DUF4350 domain-containing protein [Treponema sp.]